MIKMPYKEIKNLSFTMNTEKVGSSYIACEAKSLYWRVE